MKTLGIAVSAGYDCDNQAATCAGLIAVLNGTKCLPKGLIEEFKDQYVCFTRDDVPIATPISNIVERITKIAKEAIIANGGRTEHTPGEAPSIAGKTMATEIYGELFNLKFNAAGKVNASGGWLEKPTIGDYEQNGDIVKLEIEGEWMEGAYDGENIKIGDYIPGEITYIINSDL